MEVILFEAVQNLGSVGDTVRVKSGYARNYLIPQGKAAFATPEARAAVEAHRVELEKQEAVHRTEAEQRAQALEGKTFEVARKAGEEGKLFGSVGTADLVEVIAELGLEVTRHEILLPEGPLRQLGDYELQVRMHTDVEATIHVTIIAEE